MNANTAELHYFGFSRKLMCDLSGFKRNQHVIVVISHKRKSIVSMSSNEAKLLGASKAGDDATVRALLAEGNVDVQACDKLGRTPLYYASLLGHVQVVDLLLQYHADPNTADQKDAKTPLHDASMYGHLQVVELLLKANANPNVASKLGWTPLHLAALFDHLEAVDLLLAAYADPNAADGEGKTPLHYACRSHRGEATQVLLASGADLHAKDLDGFEPLHRCIFNWYSDVEVTEKTLMVLQVLVSFGATWDVKCDELVATEKAYAEAPALRICMLLWAKEHSDRLPFTNIPLEVVLRGVDSTQAFIDDLKTSTEIVLRRKICLVGSSCAGKTSLVKSITSEEPQLVHLDDRTIGIDHFPLRFKECSAGSETVGTHEVTFWDFAGQDAYQVAHSLFFSPRSLFLVCVDLEAYTTAVLQASIMSDMTKQEIQLMDEFIDRTVMRWIRMIVARQPDAEFVFVVTKEDLLAENKVTELLFKKRIIAKLKEVKATVQQMRDQLEKEKRSVDDMPEALELPIQQMRTKLPADEWETPIADSEKGEDVDTSEPTIVFASCASLASVKAARARIEDLIIQSKRSFQMPDTYTQVLDAIVGMRNVVNTNDITTRLHHVFVPVDALPAKLKIEPQLCRTILQTLHDLGDVLWYEDLGVELFQNTVILDPLLLIDFIRQVVNHTHRGVTMSHADLTAKPFWMGLSSEQQMKAMKQVLQKFRLVYPDEEDNVMRWDSDLIVPAFWQTKTPASWLFLGDILRINSTKSCDGEAVRVEWEFHFEYGLPSSLFDQVVVASVSPYVKFEAGPDWIAYEEKEIAACRIMVGRDVKSLHRTIHVEAVVAEAATKKQVDKLWRSFQQLCGAFVGVLREYPGLAGVSSFAWDDDHTKINLKRLVQSRARISEDFYPSWLPPSATWKWFKELTTKCA